MQPQGCTGSMAGDAPGVAGPPGQKNGLHARLEELEIERLRRGWSSGRLLRSGPRQREKRQNDNAIHAIHGTLPRDRGPPTAPIIRYRCTRLTKLAPAAFLVTGGAASAFRLNIRPPSLSCGWLRSACRPVRPGHRWSDAAPAHRQPHAKALGIDQGGLRLARWSP